MIGAQGYYEYLAGHTAGMDLNAYATRTSVNKDRAPGLRGGFLRRPGVNFAGLRAACLRLAAG